MKFFVALLLVGLAVASPLKPLDDAFLQEHSHRFLFTQKVEKEDNFSYVEYGDMIRSVSFCLRNFQETGIDDASMCMGHNWMQRKTTEQMLQSFLNQQVSGDVTVTVKVSDDAKIEAIAGKGIKWTASGTVTVQGKDIAYEREGAVVVSKNRITFEEMAKVKQDKLSAGAAVYVDVDVESKTEDNVVKTIAGVSFNQVVGAIIDNADGSVVEATSGSQANILAASQTTTSDDASQVATEATAAGTQIAHVHKHASDGSETHVIASKSDAVDFAEVLNVDFSTAGTIKVTASQGAEGVSHLYAGKPLVRQIGVSAASKTATITGTKSKFSITAHDDIKSKANVADYEDNLLASIDGSATLDNQVDVTVADNSVDVQGTLKGSGKATVTPAQGSVVTVTDTLEATAHFTGKNNGDGTGTAHADVDVTVTVHTE